MVQVSSSKQEEAALLNLIVGVGDILGGEPLQSFVVHDWEEIGIRIAFGVTGLSKLVEIQVVVDAVELPHLSLVVSCASLGGLRLT